MRLARLLRVIAERAATPVEQARTLPAAAYVSEELLALERTRIFARDWVCAGRADEIPAAGDFLTLDLVGTPVAVMRQTDGALRAFVNVCRHRAMRLLDGDGHCDRRINCPYHGWSYGLDGQLAGAPHMQSRPGFHVAEVRLPALACETWQGWIYVSLDPTARSVAERLRDLEPLVAAYATADYRHLVREDHEWTCNWKLLTENFMEGYHLPIAHRRTVGAWFPAEATHFPETVHEDFTWQTFLKDEEASYGVAPPANTRLEGLARRTSLMPTVFPSHMYVLAPDHLWYLSLQPVAVDRVRIRFGIALAPELDDSLADRDAFRERMLGFFTAVNAEDRAVVENVYRGLQSGRAEDAAPLCWLERELHDFSRYLAARLCGAVSSHAPAPLADAGQPPAEEDLPALQ